MTMTSSDMTSASRWSWVTLMVVTPSSRWMRRNSSCMSSRSFRSRASERLVEQQQVGLEDQGAGDRDALLLAAGKLVRAARAEAAEPDQLEIALDPLGDAARRKTTHAQRIGDIVEGA